MKRLLALAAIAATGSILVGSAPASAINCPAGTRAETVHVPGTDRTVTVCNPIIYCDPAACW